MVSIHTNLSSLIAQGSLTKSTNTLNRAIEQMSTGYKINHASDNAANYSIKTNMDTKIGAYMVAEDNAMMGLDMLQTAESSLNQISDKLSRLRALAVTAQNGTYGDQSKAAINAEANALVDEIERIYSNTNYNGIDLMRGKVLSTEESKFIKDIDRRDTSKMTTLASVDETIALTSGTYSISTAEELAKLATMTNNGLIGANTEFVLGADIDLSGYANWTPIGIRLLDPNNSSILLDAIPFEGVFDGNGFVISNLKITSASVSSVGIFGYVNDAIINNLAVVDVNITCDSVLAGGLFGCVANSNIDNCYASGDIVSSTSSSSAKYRGGIAGTVKNNTIISNCYSTCNIERNNCYYAYVGGVVGTLELNSVMDNCFSTGDLSAQNYVGGLIGIVLDSNIFHCYSTSDVLTKNNYAGSFISMAAGNCFVEDSYSSGIVSSSGYNAGGFIGRVGWGTAYTDLDIINCSVLSVSPTATGIFVSGYNGIHAHHELFVQGCSYNSEYDDLGTPIMYEKYNIAGNEYNLDVKSVKNFVDITTNVGLKSYEISTASQVYRRDSMLNIQVGINNDIASSINVSINNTLNNINFLRQTGKGLNNIDLIPLIDELIQKISLNQVRNGTVLNRLESVLEEINVQYENLVSSRSTIQDADMGEVSATYIQQQILQQASATLMATANQTPAIALQLI